MMPDIHAALLAISNSPAAWIVTKATVIAALGLTSAGLARRSRAAVRHALLAVAFGALVALPLVSMAAPPIRIALRIAAEAAPVPHAPPIGAVPFTAPDAPVAAPAVSQSSRLSPSALLLVVWLAGAALFLLPVIVGLRQVRRLRRTALPWRHGQTVAEGLAFDAGVPRRIEGLLHEELPAQVRGPASGHRAARGRTELEGGGPEPRARARDRARPARRLGQPLPRAGGMRCLLVSPAGLDGVASACARRGAGLRRRGAGALGGDRLRRPTGGSRPAVIGGGKTAQIGRAACWGRGKIL